MPKDLSKIIILQPALFEEIGKGVPERVECFTRGLAQCRGHNSLELLAWLFAKFNCAFGFLQVREQPDMLFLRNASVIFK